MNRSAFNTILAVTIALALLAAIRQMDQSTPHEPKDNEVGLVEAAGDAIAHSPKTFLLVLCVVAGVAILAYLRIAAYSKERLMPSCLREVLQDYACRAKIGDDALDELGQLACSQDTLLGKIVASLLDLAATKPSREEWLHGADDAIETNFSKFEREDGWLAAAYGVTTLTGLFLMLGGMVISFSTVAKADPGAATQSSLNASIASALAVTLIAILMSISLRLIAEWNSQRFDATSQEIRDVLRPVRIVIGKTSCAEAAQPKIINLGELPLQREWPILTNDSSDARIGQTNGKRNGASNGKSRVNRSRPKKSAGKTSCTRKGGSNAKTKKDK